MVDWVNCPRCTQRVAITARTCEHCGVDLALAAVEIERSLITSEQIPAGLAITPEILVPRLGEYLVKRGFLKPEQIEYALNYQKERLARGESVLIGQALLELGIIDRASLDDVITRQILELQAALQDANLQLEKRVQERTDQLHQALDRLAELDQLKSNFISNISHELRTPLTHLKGYLEITAQGGLGPLSDQQKGALAVMQKAELRLEKLIDDLIQFALAWRGEFNLEIAPVRMDELVVQAITRIGPRAEARQIELRHSLDILLPPAMADENKIGWVINHLVENAVKFTEPGGLVEVECISNDEEVTIKVTDTGIGIPEERLTEIFEPFHQLDGSSTRRYAGTGLGLAMVKRILEAHQSSIRVKSAVDKGSCFEFSLPAYKETIKTEKSGAK